jgi:anti-anti-sigma regulatory factor
MSKRTEILEISSKDNEAVVRFRSLEFPNELVLEQCRADLEEYLKSHPCELLTFDLKGVVIIPSTMLGLFLTFRQRGIRIRILNPSEHVIAVLQVTKLMSKIEVEPATGVAQE